MLDAIHDINQMKFEEFGDPEIETRIKAYELAYRMQTSVPELMDISQESKETLDLYGAEPGQASYANNCLLARRLAERGVRFIQLYHRGWDAHGNLPAEITRQCNQTDKASAALITDLKQRGMLEDTLVIWGGEFGRTPMNQGDTSGGNYGRDHHMKCFSIWMAGGGIKGGVCLGETDEFGYNIVKDPTHINDFQATVLHCMGIDHLKLTYKFQGRDYRLTDVGGKVIQQVLA
jgi:arylsulfatase A-like enzyme